MLVTAQIGISPGPTVQIGPFSGTLSHRSWNSDHSIRLPDGHRSKGQPAQKQPEASEMSVGDFEGDRGQAKPVRDVRINTQALCDRVPGRR